MNTAATPLQTLQQSYDVGKGASGPSLKTHLVASFKPSSGYTATCRAGELHITAANPVDLSSAIAQADMAIKSGHLEEFLGTHQPKCPWRILWAMQSTDLSAARILELGYNAVLLEQGSPKIVTLRQQGIAVGVIVETLESLPDVDFVLWESHLHEPTFVQGRQAEDSTLFELVLAEVKTLEERLPSGCKLIFYIPCDDPSDARQQASWMSRLCDAVGAQTFLAFPATVGHTSHPFWDTLRKLRDPSATPLLPVINGGSIGLGEGLWPVLSLEAVEECRTRMLGECFAGALVMTPLVPRSHGMLACSLWVASQAVTTGRSAQRLAETWFAARRSDIDYPSNSHQMRIAAEIASEVNRMSHAKNTASFTSGHVDLVVAKIRLLDSYYVSVEASSAIHHYFRYFSRDVWCILHYHIDRLRLPAPGAPHVVDHPGGFWTRLSSAGRTIPSAATVTTLTEPRCLADDSHMVAIFNQERI